jgi:hypothetical protein
MPVPQQGPIEIVRYMRSVQMMAMKIARTVKEKNTKSTGPAFMQYLPQF